jgi:hypothetical protein
MWLEILFFVYDFQSKEVPDSLFISAVYSNNMSSLLNMSVEDISCFFKSRVRSTGNVVF